MATFHRKVWEVRYLAPLRTDYDAKEFVSKTIVFFPGFMQDAHKADLGHFLRDTARVQNWGFLSLTTLDGNGLGPREEMENLEFDELLDAIVETLKNPKFQFGPQNKFILVGFSFGGWVALALAVSNRLGEWLGGLLLLAPAVGCLLPYFIQTIEALRAMGRKDEVKKVESGEVIRLGPEFGAEEGWPVSNTFQSSSWGFSLGGLKLDLANLTTPVSLIVGDEDPRVTPIQIEDLYKRIPAGNKRMTRISLLKHSFDTATVYASAVLPEIIRLAREATPNLVGAEADAHLMQDLDSQAWVLTRTGGGNREYHHLSTGHTVKTKVAAELFVRNLNEKDEAMGVRLAPTEEDNMWSGERTEVEQINPQTHPLDYIPPVQPETMDEETE